MKKLTFALVALATSVACAEITPPHSLWKNGDAGIKVYRIPALCTAPNGDLVAACDARKNHGGDLNSNQPINITIRRSTDNGKTWTSPENSYTWPWTETEHWAGSDPSFIVDKKAKKIFLFYNVWECINQGGIYKFYVQESSDNGKTWSKPRDITKDIAHKDWPFAPEKGFIFISSGSGIQTKDGTLLHTIVWVAHGNLLFGSKDHGKTWEAVGNPTKGGDECKVVELNDGTLMINSRQYYEKGSRLIHKSKDFGKSWESNKNTDLIDPRCNAQIMRYGEKALLFSNCKSMGRDHVTVRTSLDEGATWNDGILLCPEYSAYSDMTILKNGDIGVLYEATNRIDFRVITKDEIKKSIKK